MRKQNFLILLSFILIPEFVSSLFIFHPSNLPETTRSEKTDNTENITVFLIITLASVDFGQECVSCGITVKFRHINNIENVENVKFEISDWRRPSTYIDCDRDNVSAYWKGYSGDVDLTLWGNVEDFPLDSYSLIFNLDGQYKLHGASDYTRFNITLDEFSCAEFGIGHMEDCWEFTHNHPNYTESLGQIILTDFDDPYAIPYYLTSFRRRPAVPFVQLILPAILCYLLLGSSLLIDRKKLSLRLRVYLPLFVLAPTLLLSMQPILPSHGAYGLLLPEALLTNLIVATTIFAVSSIVHLKSDFKGFYMDMAALVIALVVSIYTLISGLSYPNPYIYLSAIFALMIGPTKKMVDSLREVLDH